MPQIFRTLSASWKCLTRFHLILISPPNVAIEHLFPPYTKEKVEALSQWTEY
jgi:aldehyde dehydrogenase (NAD+)